MTRKTIDGELRYAQLPDGAMVLQQWFHYHQRWMTLPVVQCASLDDNKFLPAAVVPPPAPAALTNDTVSTLTPSSNRVLPAPLPAPADAPDLDTLIASLLGGRPHECHVTHVDQCTATVDLRDLMRVAGPEWREKLAAIDATHATNQAARIAREAKEEADSKKPKPAAAQP